MFILKGEFAKYILLFFHANSFDHSRFFIYAKKESTVWHKQSRDPFGREIHIIEVTEKNAGRSVVYNLHVHKFSWGKRVCVWDIVCMNIMHVYMYACIF